MGACIWVPPGVATKNVLEGGAGWSSPPPRQHGAYAPSPCTPSPGSHSHPDVQTRAAAPDAGLASPRHLELSSVRSQACARRAAEAEAEDGRTRVGSRVRQGSAHPPQTPWRDGARPGPQTGSGLLGRKPRPARVTSPKATRPRGWWQGLPGPVPQCWRIGGERGSGMPGSEEGPSLRTSLSVSA